MNLNEICCVCNDDGVSKSDDTTKRGGIVQPARITIHGAIRVLLTFHRRAVRCIRQAGIDTYFAKYHPAPWIRGLSYGLGSLILG
ncbi:hypothetical protein ALC57_08106 [Trachymyrmex cornetzi]|uniref:Uncharacterized protein n=1 Tax=Trachymyrmex cornetzi TaxID=471704 RepID=A0A195E391_9HYME|nr:hypothetical protein ALC57_08106 [Trachymyrmex cornetzi]